MELVVHGTKQGYKSSFIPNIQPSFSLGDIRNGVNNEGSLGKSLYSLAFLKNGCVFTKYIIVRDTLRSLSIGNIAFSIFLPSNRELLGKGADVKSLLDKLSTFYLSNYVTPDHNINRGEMSLIQEDWSFIKGIISEYKEQDKNRNEEEITQGSQDPAIHYYSSDAELIAHLDKPFQIEYKEYKQIFFIDVNLKGPSNPLNVLRNCGVEVNPDLKEEIYYLNNTNQIKGLTITANNLIRSDRKCENRIKSKWRIQIKCVIDDRCYESIIDEGTLSDSQFIDKYFLKTGNQLSPRNRVFDPRPKTKKIIFEIKDRYGRPVNGAEIQIGTQDWQEVVGSSVSHDFIGENIIKPTKIAVRKKIERLHSDPQTITPINENGPVSIVLNQRAVVTVYAKDQESGNSITNFQLWCNDGKGSRTEPEIVFENEDIDKKWRIDVLKNDGKITYKGEIPDYCPAVGGDSVTVICTKTQQPEPNTVIYNIDAGRDGKKSKTCPKHSRNRHGNDINHKKDIIPNKGYIFKNWELQGDTLVAQYEKNDDTENIPWGKVLTVTAIGVAALIFFLVYKYYDQRETNDDPTTEKLTKEQVTGYVEGDSLMLDKLINYKRVWESMQNDFITKTEGKWIGGGEKIDSSKWKNDWSSAYESLKRAITKRELINKKNFREVLGLKFSDKQLPFKKAVERIDSLKLKEVSDKLGMVETQTLIQIAQKINEILDQKTSENPATVLEDEKPEKEEEPKNAEQPKEKEKVSEKPEKEINIVNDKSSEIIDFLNSNNLKKEKLNEYLNIVGTNGKLKASIYLCLKLWTLDGTANKSYSSYQKELSRDPYLNNSELKKFIDAMCTKTSPNYIINLPDQDKKKSLFQIITKLQ